MAAKKKKAKKKASKKKGAAKAKRKAAPDAGSVVVKKGDAIINRPGLYCYAAKVAFSGGRTTLQLGVIAAKTEADAKRAARSAAQKRYGVRVR